MSAQEEWLPEPENVIPFRRPRYERSWRKRVLDGSEAREGALLVLLILAEHATRKGVVCIPMSEIARMAKLHERSVRRIVCELVEAGEVEILQKGSGRGRKTLYQLRLPS